MSKKEKKDKKVSDERKQHIEDFTNLKEMLIMQKKSIDKQGGTVQLKIRLHEEINKMIFHVEKMIVNRMTPITQIETVRGLKFNIGDKFYISDNKAIVYTIRSFPDYVSANGVNTELIMGFPSTCNCYIENMVKVTEEVKKKKKDKKKKSKKKKK